MAGVTYLIRLLPLTFMRNEIRNVYVRSFLYYVPFVTLAVMVFPDILGATASAWSGLAAFLAAISLSYRKKSLFAVSLAACFAVFVVELIIL
jgi:branched-subunit amino acid transport protein